MNVYQFGFYKYWKGVWEERYYILGDDVSSESFINKIKEALKKDLDLSESVYLESQLKYINAIDACKSIQDLKEINHWYQTKLTFSFKQLELV